MTITPVDRDEAKAVDTDGVSVIERDAEQVAAQAAVSEQLAELLDEDTVALLAEQARVQAEAGGLRLLGDGGLLQAITKRVIEAALAEELAEHLDGAPAGTNERNGGRVKKLMTEVGTVPVRVPRDRAASFRPKVVARHSRRSSGIDDLVISLTARGMTSGDIVAHLKEVFDIDTTKETVSTITDKVLDGMNEWRNRPLESVYPVVMIDAIHVKVRDGQVANRAIYVALAVTADGYRDILGLWCGDGGEGAKYWAQVLTEIRNRGVADMCMLICDGLTGLPEAVNSVYPTTIVQTCIIHLIRASLRYASRADWPILAKALKPIYTAPTEDAALTRFVEFSDTWGSKYPAIVRLWERAWSEFVPFLAFDREIRTVICSTNAIESINARYRRAVSACGHFPNEQAALKRLYLATLALDPTGKGRVRWSNRWKAALGAFDITFDGRVSAAARR